MFNVVCLDVYILTKFIRIYLNNYCSVTLIAIECVHFEILLKCKPWILRANINFHIVQHRLINTNWCKFCNSFIPNMQSYSTINNPIIAKSWNVVGRYIHCFVPLFCCCLYCRFFVFLLLIFFINPI